MRSTLAIAATAAFMASDVLASAVPTATATASLFLPWPADNMAGSVITAAPSATVYVIGCEQYSGGCNANCSYDGHVTITEGPSTLVYTWTNAQAASKPSHASTLVLEQTTVNCQLKGSSTATQAICTGKGPYGNQTTTLAGSQISYYAIPLTSANMSATMSATMNATMSANMTATLTGTASIPPAAQNTNAAAPVAVGYGGAILAGLGAIALL